MKIRQFDSPVSARVGRERQWVRSVNTYGYICALLAGLAGCSGIALFLQVISHDPSRKNSAASDGQYVKFICKNKAVYTAVKQEH